MRFSSPTFYSALGACFIHSLALGFAATLMVTAPQYPVTPVRVTLLQQRAAPLPIGEKQGAEELASVREEKLIRAQIPASQIQPQSKPRELRAAPRSPVPKVARTVPTQLKKPAPPTEIVPIPLTQTAPAQFAALNPVETMGTNTDLLAGLAATTEDQGEGKPTSEGKTSGEKHRGSGPGGEGQNGKAAQPNYRVNPKPLYPMLARRLGAQGIVLLRVQVREDGSVADVEMAQSSGFSFLDESATRTVRESWQFLPARIEDGTPVASWVEVPIRFVLEDS
jgi:periplasmic protein TonB